MKNRLLHVAEGILDDSEFRDYILEDVENVWNYAHDGCGISISDEEAQHIIETCKHILKIGFLGEVGEFHCDGDDYYNEFKAKLLD